MFATAYRRSLIGFMVCLLLSSWVAGVSILTVAAADDADEKPVVRLVIDYGDGVERHFTRLAWRADMTVLNVLEEAKLHPRGFRFEHRGEGATAFVTQIDDLKNEGQGRNWLYQVNDKAGTVSCGAKKVVTNDRILWKFASFK